MTEKLTARIGALLDMTVAGVRVVGGQHGFRHLRGTLADGRAVFVKASLGGEGGDAFAAEANGLRWLAAAGAVPVPEAGS
jgi:fructosamine-3-kinase